MHLYACNLFKTLSWLRQFKFKAASSAKQPYTGRIVRTFAEEKIGKNPKLLEDYKAFVEDIVVKRYIRRAPPYQRESVCEVKTWFIPHRGVYHPHRPGKICVVFDCAARYRGKSVKDLVFKGPDITNFLLEVLLQDFARNMWQLWRTSSQCSTSLECLTLTVFISPVSVVAKWQIIMRIGRILDDSSSVWRCIVSCLFKFCPPENGRR